MNKHYTQQNTKQKLPTTTPKANAAIKSSADKDEVVDDDLISLGIYGKPH